MAYWLPFCNTLPSHSHVLMIGSAGLWRKAQSAHNLPLSPLPRTLSLLPMPSAALASLHDTAFRKRCQTQVWDGPLGQGLPCVSLLTRTQQQQAGAQGARAGLTSAAESDLQPLLAVALGPDPSIPVRAVAGPLDPGLQS